MTLSTFALLTHAISDPTTDFRAGARHAVLVFARAEDEEDATQRTFAALRASG